MGKLIRALLVDDSADDVQMLVREIHNAGYTAEYQRVETAAALSGALSEKSWDIVLAEHKMPNLSGSDALRLFKRANLDCPFIIVSHTISDESGVAMMQRGAHDYVMKSNLKRLLPAIERELQQAELRRLGKGAHERLQHLASHDLLTDLPNYGLFSERVSQTISSAQHARSQVAVLLMRVNRFQEMSEALGDPLCDVLMVQLARRLTAEARSSLTFSCLRSNEFAVLIAPAHNRNAALEVVYEITKILERPFIIADGLKLEIQVSFGIALFPEHATTADLLIRKARGALALATKGHAAYAFYAEEQESSHRQLALVGDLRRAIIGHQLFLLYQPKVELATLRLAGVEALVRWKHPQLGILTPDQFIPMAEKTGLIMPLTLWVLNEALRQCSNWNRDNVPVSVAVNLSPWNLQSSALPDQIRGLLKGCGVPPSQLELELTESAIMANPRLAAEILTVMKQMGLKLAVDDFGTGYSSLAHLNRLPIDSIKIDKSFVIRMVTETQDTVIVRSMIHLAHNLGLKVVAEGVENRETLDMLRKMGCDMAQGYHISHPRPAEELPGRLQNALVSGL